MVYRNLVRLGLLGVGSGVVTYNFDELETAGIGAVRFGRAAVTVRDSTVYRSIMPL